MLYASYHPERIEGMFLQSPACAEDETREGWVYDPYSVRLVDTEDVYPSRSDVDKGIENYANNVHIQAGMHSMPLWLMRMGCRSNFRKMLKEELFSDAYVNAAAEYYALMTRRAGQQDVVC